MPPGSEVSAISPLGGTGGPDIGRRQRLDAVQRAASLPALGILVGPPLTAAPSTEVGAAGAAAASTAALLVADRDRRGAGRQRAIAEFRPRCCHPGS
jgi:hypothetical protein